jgi:hypothetical protein
MKQVFALSLWLCLSCFACVSSTPPIQNFQNQSKPYEGDVPDRVLKDSLTVRGRYLEVEMKQNTQVVSGELLAVYDIGIVMNEMSRETFDSQTAKDFKLRIIEKNQIEQLAIFDMVSVYNGTIYGSIHWIIYPFLTLSHGLFMIFSVPTWMTVFLYQMAYGFALKNMIVEINQSFDLKFLVPFSRFPHHLPKSIEEKLSIQTVESENQSALPFHLSLGVGLGIRYSQAGVYAGVHYQLDRIILGVGASYTNLIGQSSIFSAHLGYLISQRKTLFLSAGQELLSNDYRISYQYIGFDYLYDFGEVGGFKLLGGANLIKYKEDVLKIASFTPNFNVGIHYEF